MKKSLIILSLFLFISCVKDSQPDLKLGDISNPTISKADSILAKHLTVKESTITIDLNQEEAQKLGISSEDYNKFLKLIKEQNQLLDIMKDHGSIIHFDFDSTTSVLTKNNFIRSYTIPDNYALPISFNAGNRVICEAACNSPLWSITIRCLNNSDSHTFVGTLWSTPKYTFQASLGTSISWSFTAYKSAGENCIATVAFSSYSEVVKPLPENYSWGECAVCGNYAEPHINGICSVCANYRGY